MQSVALFIKHRALAGRRDEVRAVWERHMPPIITSNSAHEAYFYCFDVADPDTILVYQQYTDAQAATAFLETESYKRYLLEVEDLLESQPEVRQATPVWVKTLQNA